jgi:GNAT superfamily N-acetyltransferase
LDCAGAPARLSGFEFCKPADYFAGRVGNESQFLIELLDASRHRREDFSCESPELTEFLRTRARKETKARASACFVLVPVADRGRIAGFYTLSATSVALEKVPEELSRKLPRYPELPATLLGRLARDSSFKGQGIGNLLMVDALKRAYETSSVIGAVAVVTDPKDDRAARFYAEFGFKLLDGHRMFLPMKAIPEWLDLPESGK